MRRALATGTIPVYGWASPIVAVAALIGCGSEQLLLGGGGNSACVPGTYAGVYDCTTIVDSSAQFDAIGGVGVSRGPIVFELQGDRGGKALHIATGSHITAMMAGGVTTVEFSGTLDCTTYELTGTVSSYTFTSPTIMAVTQVSGSISADYNAVASSPALVDGMLSLQSLAQPVTSGTCTWSASLQP
jgi:hypothetical protein